MFLEGKYLFCVYEYKHCAFSF